MPPLPSMARSVTFQLDDDNDGLSTSSSSQQQQQQQQQRQPNNHVSKPSLKTPTVRTSSYGSQTSLTASTVSRSIDNSSIGLESISSEDQVLEHSSSWRKHGKLFRAQIVLNDEKKGGNTFALSNDCSIDRYYKVAERVLDQFLATSISESSELTESYLVGNRLVKFLSVVLPTHQSYFSPDPHLLAMRNRSQAQLVELLQYMEELSLLIDEMQYNKYILRDLTPEEKSMMSQLSANTSGGNRPSMPPATSSDSKDSDKENTAATLDVSRTAPAREKVVPATSCLRNSSHRPTTETTVHSNNNNIQSSPAPPQQITKNEVKVNDEKSEWESFADFSVAKTTHSRIDLLEQPMSSTLDESKEGQETPPKLSKFTKPVPKVKPPPSGAGGFSTLSLAPVRIDYVDRVPSQIDEDRLTMDWTGNRRYGQSYLADDPVQKLPAMQSSQQTRGKTSDGEAIEVTTKIEQRLEQAAKLKRILDGHEKSQYMQLEDLKRQAAKARAEEKLHRSALTASDSLLGGENEESSLTSSYANPPKKILAQFKGCVRCLID